MGYFRKIQQTLKENPKENFLIRLEKFTQKLEGKKILRVRREEKFN